MVWFIVGIPTKKPENPKATKDLIDQGCLGTGAKRLGMIYDVNFDKTKFKIGTLDLLMKLNDALGKVDTGLEALLRKIEK